MGDFFRRIQDTQNALDEVSKHWSTTKPKPRLHADGAEITDFEYALEEACRWVTDMKALATEEGRKVAVRPWQKSPHPEDSVKVAVGEHFVFENEDGRRFFFDKNGKPQPL